MFKKAYPVFAAGKEKELNYTLLLRGRTESLVGSTLYVTAASFYRLTVNGRFVAFGPARTAAGYARVDKLSLGKYHREGGNEIVIEVAGYACRSLSTVKQDSFVVAELCRGEEVLLATGRDFDGYRSAHRQQKVERYSGQRHFGEIYDYTEQDPFAKGYRVELEKSKQKLDFLPRVVPYPTYERVSFKEYSSCGTLSYRMPKDFRANRYSFAETMTDYWGYYHEEEVAEHPYRWIQTMKMTHKRCGKFPITIREGEYVIVDMKTINAGFFEFGATALSESEVVLGFSELCSPRKFEFTNINSQNVIQYRLPKGAVRAHSFEPYTARVVVLMVKKGALRLNSFAMRRFEHDRARLLPRKVRDAALRRIYAAAETTFLHNAVDIYTDCPSRERAGWLCDSYFTGRAEYFLTGESRVEDAFLENYRLYRPTGELPDGVLPMCFPADIQFLKQEHPLPRWIPQWNMWYVLEVCEYLSLRRPDVDRELFRESVYGVLRSLERNENSDGLLENLPSWNFVEWSTANEWVQNVNYPTNFLYAEVLRATGNLYQDQALLEKSARVRATTVARSFDGEVFIDNAVRGEDGKLYL